jgi:signal transduction histidine kinase
MKFLPKTLSGQLLALLSLALIGSLAVSLFLFIDERALAVREADRLGLLDRIAAVGRMLDVAPAGERGRLAEAAGSPRIRFWTTEKSALPAPADSAGRVMLAHEFDHMFPAPLREPPRLAFVGLGRPPPPRDHAGDDRPDRFPGPQFDVVASVPFHDGGWLNAQTQIHAEPVPLPLPSLLSAAIMAVASFAIVVIVARRVTRPLKALADSADAFGRGAPAPLLAEAGPDEARRLIATFNRMQQRLVRFVADRTRMLAAIGHDLRTPITSLKLRAELLDDEEAKAKMLATLDEMEHMTEATLAFAREDATTEPSRTIDLAAAIASQIDDLAELGKPVTFAEAPRLAYSFRPMALKRAIGNLIENAVQYGERARVSLQATSVGPVITVDDDGPGIAEAKMEEAFKPFVRLEASRSRATGGIGLGLAIARSIVLAHGGELILSNRPEGGLRAEIRLPAEQA